MRHCARTAAHSVDASMLERRREGAEGGEGGVSGVSGEIGGGVDGDGEGVTEGDCVNEGAACEGEGKDGEGGRARGSGDADEIDLRNALPRIVCFAPAGVEGGTTSSARSVRTALPDSGGELVNTSLRVRPR